MAKQQRKPTWLEVAIHYGGMRNAIKATNFAYCWAVTREALDRDPTAEEVAEWWNTSERTSYRDQAAFRKSFPMLESPAPIYSTPEARETLARHAAFGDKIEEWGKQRRRKREIDSVKALILPAINIEGLPD